MGVRKTEDEELSPSPCCFTHFHIFDPTKTGTYEVRWGITNGRSGKSTRSIEGGSAEDRAIAYHSLRSPMGLTLTKYQVVLTSRECRSGKTRPGALSCTCLMPRKRNQIKPCMGTELKNVH